MDDHVIVPGRGPLGQPMRSEPGTSASVPPECQPIAEDIDRLTAELQGLQERIDEPVPVFLRAVRRANQQRIAQLNAQLAQRRQELEQCIQRAKPVDTRPTVQPAATVQPAPTVHPVSEPTIVQPARPPVRPPLEPVRPWPPVGPPGPPTGPSIYKTEVSVIDRSGTVALPAQGRMWELVPPSSQRDLEARTLEGTRMTKVGPTQKATGEVAFSRAGSIPGKSVGISIQEAANPTFVGPLFRSGPLASLPAGAPSNPAGRVEIGIPAPIPSPGTILTAGFPPVPFTAPGSSPPLTVTSLTPMLGSGDVALTVGLGYFLGTVKFEFTYALTFRIAPSFNMNSLAEICTLVPSGPGRLTTPQAGFLVGVVLGNLLKEPSVRANVVSAILGALNATILTTVASSFGLTTLPPGVVVSMRSVEVSPSGITLFPALGAYGGLLNRIPF